MSPRSNFLVKPSQIHRATPVTSPSGAANPVEQGDSLLILRDFQPCFALGTQYGVIVKKFLLAAVTDGDSPAGERLKASSNVWPSASVTPSPRSLKRRKPLLQRWLHLTKGTPRSRAPPSPAMISPVRPAASASTSRWSRKATGPLGRSPRSGFRGCQVKTSSRTRRQSSSRSHTGTLRSPMLTGAPSPSRETGATHPVSILGRSGACKGRAEKEMRSQKTIRAYKNESVREWNSDKMELASVLLFSSPTACVVARCLAPYDRAPPRFALGKSRKRDSRASKHVLPTYLGKPRPTRGRLNASRAFEFAILILDLSRQKRLVRCQHQRDRAPAGRVSAPASNGSEVCGDETPPSDRSGSRFCRTSFRSISG